MNKFLEEFSVIQSRTVQFSELGITEHVNNVNYFRYFDDARAFYLDHIDFPSFYQDTGINYIVVSNHCDYKAELRYLDELKVGIRVSEITKHKAKIEFALYCSNKDRIAASGYTIILCFDYEQGKHVPFPQTLKERIEKLENRTF